MNNGKKLNPYKHLIKINYEKDIKNNEFKKELFNILVNRAKTTSYIETTKINQNGKIEISQETINVPIDYDLVNTLIKICETSKSLEHVKKELLEIKKIRGDL